MEGVIGRVVYIPQWGERATICGIDFEELSYHLTMDSGDDAYVPFCFVEVLH